MVALLNEFEIWEDTGVSLMARVKVPTGNNMTIEDISSIDYSVYDQSAPTTAIKAGILNVSSVVFNSLQTDARWQEDNTGYNFRWDVPAANFPNGARRYRLEVKMTPFNGEPFHLVWEVVTKNLNRS